MDAPPRERPSWPIVAIVLLLGFAGGTVAYWKWPTPPVAVPQRVASVTPAAPIPPVKPADPIAAEPRAAEPKAAELKPTGPTFDVVRVGPQGRAVVAGRAESGAEVTLRDGGHVLGKTTADAQGAFVILPDEILPPGGRELTLSARDTTGKVAAGGNSVLLVVPQASPPSAVAETANPVVAVLLPKDATPPRVLQGGANRKLALDTVDYDEKGEIRFSGSAKPEAPMRLYVDNQPVAESKAGADGQWTAVPAHPVTPGIHQLRVDHLGTDGRVLSRVELPFQRTAVTPDPAAGLGPDSLSGGRAVVQPGQNLWRIARQTYGQGVRYTVIYLANRDQIRDPSRIYPGQIFSVPPRS